MPTRNDYISELKSRGVRGKLSKMTKRELAKLMRETAHGHDSDDEPQQVGSGSKHSQYQAFVAGRLKSNGGDLKQAAADYREQTGGARPGTPMRGEEEVEALMDRGIELMNAGTEDKATEYFEEVLELDPKYTLAQEWLDTARLQEKKLLDAQRRLALVKIPGLDPDAAHMASLTQKQRESFRRGEQTGTGSCGEQSGEGKGFFTDLVHGKMKDLGGDLSHDWKHGLGKAVEYGGMGALMFTGLGELGAGAALFGDAAEAGEAAESGLGAAEDGADAMRTGMGEADLTDAADDAAEDAKTELGHGEGALGGRLARLGGRVVKKAMPALGFESLKADVLDPMITSAGGDAPAGPDPAATLKAMQEAQAAAAKKREQAEDYISNLKSLSNNTGGGGGGGINPWG